MELVICRHGESKGNIVEYDYPDPELTGFGKQQAELLAQRLACESFDCILCSPLVRAIQTAYAQVPYQNTIVEVSVNIREVRGLESFKGLSCKEILEYFPRVKFTEEHKQTDCGWIDPGGESKQQAFMRASKVIEYIKHNFKGSERVLVIAHGTFNSMLISCLLGLELDPCNVRFQQNNACINRFIINEDECKVGCINDCRHLISLEGFDTMKKFNDAV